MWLNNPQDKKEMTRGVMRWITVLNDKIYCSQIKQYYMGDLDSIVLI